jgi:hypothetical protein
VFGAARAEEMAAPTHPLAADACEDPGAQPAKNFRKKTLTRFRRCVQMNTCHFNSK